jgi:hypothetical protein
LKAAVIKLMKQHLVCRRNGGNSGNEIPITSPILHAESVILGSRHESIAENRYA